MVYKSPNVSADLPALKMKKRKERKSVVMAYKSTMERGWPIRMTSKLQEQIGGK